MITVILAGGFGTRLRPVVQGLPKPMAPVHDRFFLDYVLAQLKQNGLNEFIFCLHYMAKKIVEHFGDGSRYGVNIDYSIEKEPLGTGGALGLLRGRLAETFCVVNADTYLELDVQGCLQYHQIKEVLVTMALASVYDGSRYGRVQLEEGGRIRGFVEKSPHQKAAGYINAGLYLMEPQVFDFIRENTKVSLEKDVFPLVINHGRGLYGYPHVTTFFDIGIPEDYERFKRWVLHREMVKRGSSMEQKIDSVCKQIEDSVRVKQALRGQAATMLRISERIAACFRRGNKAWLHGNGGSAADAQHIAAELAGKFYLDRDPLPAVALTANPSVLTAIGNDYSFEEIFARQVRGLVQPGDVVIGLSTSGNSPNVIKALEEAKRRGAWTVAFTGQGGKIKEVADECLSVPSVDTPRVQEAHLTAGHIICCLVEELMFAGEQA